MFLKSIITAIIIMTLTGGFIYWGTDIQPNKADLAPKSTASVEDVAAKVIEVSQKETDKKDKDESVWVDLNLRDSSTAVQEGAVDQKEALKSHIADVVKTKTPKARPVKAKPVKDAKKLHVMRLLKSGQFEADKITQVDLKDQAYLRLVDYAVVNKKYVDAKALLVSLSSPELRDTARSRIAIGMALSGHDKSAFALLEEVEVEALQDVLRLQVIEAATDLNVPHKAP